MSAVIESVSQTDMAGVSLVRFVLFDARAEKVFSEVIRCLALGAGH